jgi:hypothetical protein
MSLLKWLSTALLLLLVPLVHAITMYGDDEVGSAIIQIGGTGDPMPAWPSGGWNMHDDEYRELGYSEPVPFPRDKLIGIQSIIYSDPDATGKVFTYTFTRLNHRTASIANSSLRQGLGEGGGNTLIKYSSNISPYNGGAYIELEQGVCLKTGCGSPKELEPFWNPSYSIFAKGDTSKSTLFPTRTFTNPDVLRGFVKIDYLKQCLLSKTWKLEHVFNESGI